jgi:arylsulfatase A-like enzyme
LKKASVLICFLLFVAAVFAQQKPNIIFILTDDLGYGDLGVFFQKQKELAGKRSEPFQVTPQLDQLAEGGATLTQHYCAAPVCAPSRASLLLGVSQGHANVRDNQFDKAVEDNHTLGSVLQKAGYATAAIGKWGLQGQGNAPDWPAHPLNRGFDYYYGYIRHVDGHEHYPKEGVYRGPKEVWENRTEVSKDLDKCYTGDLWTAAAKKWIIDQKTGKDAGKPFFMFLAYDVPHAVLELPTQPYPPGGGLKGGLQWMGTPGHMINTASGTVDSWVHPDYAMATYDHDHNPSTAEVPWPDTYKRYATSVRRIDEGVGDLIQLLKDLQIDSNTLVVFTSDNGPSLESYLPKEYVPNHPDFFTSFGPLDGVKRDCWEGGVRVPTIAWWPRQIPAGRIIKTPSISYDWLPTFTDVAGLPAPVRTDGVSLLPSLTGNGEQLTGLVYIEYFQNGKTPDFSEFAVQRRKRTRNQMQMIRKGDTVGIRYDIKSPADDFEIYDVVKDPGQTRNLAQEPALATLQQQMKERVLQVRRPDSSAARPYDHEPIPAVSKKEVKKGVNWKLFTGNFPWVPDMRVLKPSATGQATVLDARVVKPSENAVLCFEGYLRILEDGAYTFCLKANSGTFLRIHEAAIIDGDYKYSTGTELQGKVMLKVGLHPFKLYYTNQAGDKPLLNLEWEGPGISRQPVPARVFYRDSQSKKR